MKVLLASFEPRRERTSTDWRFVRKPTRHASSRQFESQPAETRGRYEHTLNARPDPPSGRSGARCIASRSAATQLASVLSLIPNDRAISTRGRSEVFTNSTASRRNSGGYFDGPHAGLLPLASRQNQVSTEAGQGHTVEPQVAARLCR
jgi:hypothetical protein